MDKIFEELEEIKKSSVGYCDTLIDANKYGIYRDKNNGMSLRDYIAELERSLSGDLHDSPMAFGARKMLKDIEYFLGDQNLLTDDDEIERKVKYGELLIPYKAVEKAFFDHLEIKPYEVQMQKRIKELEKEKINLIKALLKSESMRVKSAMKPYQSGSRNWFIAAIILSTILIVLSIISLMMR